MFYGLTLWQCHLIIQELEPAIVDVPLMLILGGSNNIVTSIFAYTGGQYCDCGLMPLHSPVIIQYPRLKIFDTPLTLITRMGQ